MTSLSVFGCSCWPVPGEQADDRGGVWHDADWPVHGSASERSGHLSSKTLARSPFSGHLAFALFDENSTFHKNQPNLFHLACKHSTRLAPHEADQTLMNRFANCQSTALLDGSCSADREKLFGFTILNFIFFAQKKTLS